MIVQGNMRIRATGSYAPERVLTNIELASKVGSDPSWIYENLGIKERRIAEADQYTSDLATSAARKALDGASYTGEEIGLILVATATPDRKAPSTACLVKHKLGIENQYCAAMDIAAVCSGFLYGLTMAASLVSVYKRILLIGADTFSKITDWERRDAVFFGDGAGAAIIEEAELPGTNFSGEIYTHCQNPNHFTVYPGEPTFSMNGRAVYETGSTVLPSAIKRILDFEGVETKDVDWIIPHQPSIRLLQKTAEKLDIPFSKFQTNMAKYANTSGATIPILLDEVNRNKELREGDNVVFAAVGSGWTWGACYLKWN